VTQDYLNMFRSKTRITDAVLAESDRLLAIGCFCIGTDQVDLDSAEKRGVITSS